MLECATISVSTNLMAINTGNYGLCYSDTILGLQPRDKAAMLGVKTKEYFLEEFT